MAKPNPSIVLVGPLTIWEQEGGYAAPAVSVGDSDVGAAIDWCLTLVRYKGSD